MRYPNFCGPSYTSQSPLADCAALRNWYLETMEEDGERVVCYPTPGRQLFSGIANGITDIGGRALLSIGGFVRAVFGVGLYSISENGSATRLDSGAQDSMPATISYNGANGNQFFYTTGGNGYIEDATSHVVTQVLTGDATMGGMIDGYFLAFDLETSTFRISDLNDGLTWDPTQFQQNSITADPWQAMVCDGNRKIWFVGEQRGQIWYDQGTFPFPFTPYPGAVFNFGTPAPFSVKVAGDSVMWLTKNENGQAQVVRTVGFQPRRVSDYSVETAIAGYSRTATINDAEALVYEDGGHLFYCLTFPSANATWVYDVSTGQWHERDSTNAQTGRSQLWRPRVHCYAFGQHLTAERENGTIATMDTAIGTELDGEIIRRLRIPAPLRVKERRGRGVVKRFEADFEPGTASLTGQGAVPQAMFRSSDTFGRTWSMQREASPGRTGQRNAKVFWNRCGDFDDTWVPEITVTDPNPWRLVDGFVDGFGF